MATPPPDEDKTLKLDLDQTLKLDDLARLDGTVKLDLGALNPIDATTIPLGAGNAYPPAALPELEVLPAAPVEDPAEVLARKHAAIREEIMVQLARMQSLHDIRILLAVESGSRAWGFESPNSDWDVRFIYVPKLPWYLRVGTPRDVIELPISGDLDINGWELRKTLGLMQKCNPTLLEWLQSPLIYHQDESVTGPLRSLAREFFTPLACWHHYLSMAKTNNREYLQSKSVRLKKYLYVLRPLLCCQWIEQYKSPPPMLFQTLIDMLVKDDELRAAIDGLLVQKRAAQELDEGPRIPALNYFIETELARCEQVASTIPPHKAPPDAYFRCDQFLHSVVTGG